MSQSNPNDKADTSDQIKNPRPINGEKTWLRHKADAESGMIDLMILSGNFKINQMIKELSKNPNFKSKDYHQWEQRIKEHILHLSTLEGDSRNRASGMGGHNLRIKKNESGTIAFDL
jgi:hypothetical protein